MAAEDIKVVKLVNYYHILLKSIVSYKNLNKVVKLEYIYYVDI